MTPRTPKFTDSGLLEILTEGGVFEKLKELVTELTGRLPEGVKPSEAQLDVLFAQAMASVPGLIRTRLDEVKAHALQLILTGKGPISHDPSALA